MIMIKNIGIINI